MELVVIHPFGGYEVGTQIAEEKEIAQILDSDNADKVVKISPSKPVVKVKAK